MTRAMRRGLSGLLLLGVACDAGGDRPGVVVLPGMVESVPYDAYDPNPITGSTLQRPPEGTVPHGVRPLEHATTAAVREALAGEAAQRGRRSSAEMPPPVERDLPEPEDALVASARSGLRNPFPATEANLSRGRELYGHFCGVCHGPGGEGDGPIIGRFPNPPNLLAPRARTLGDAELFHLITHGQGIMAPYAAQIRPDDRWKVALHVRQLQGRVEPVQEAGMAPGGEAEPESEAPAAVEEPS